MTRSHRGATAQQQRLGRLITAIALGAGLAALMLALLPAPKAREGSLPRGDAPDLAQPAAAAHAAPASRAGSGSAVSSAAVSVGGTPQRIVRQAAPREAVTALDARAIAGQVTAGAPGGTTALAPFSVAVIEPPGESATDLARSLVGGLNQAGISARLSDLAHAGRPDVLLALAAVPDASNEAWFCDPGPEGSSLLAIALLDSVGPGAATAPGAPRTEFACEAIHAGRASVPAVLLEFTAGAPPDAALIVSALEGFFRQQRSQVLAARSAPRLIWPAHGPVTSHYTAIHPLGIDIGQSSGGVVAATGGVVVFAGGKACCSYGLYVVVEGNDGLGTLYAHLSSINVREGQRVRQGQVLGEVGCTGTCFGTHLHFEVFQSDRRQDPMRFLP